MCIKAEKDGVKIAVLKEKRTEECEYKLYSVSIGGIERYVLSAASDDDADVQMIGGTESQAKELFGRICDNCLSCYHLEDVADDYRKQIRYGRLQIFN